MVDQGKGFGAFRPVPKPTGKRKRVRGTAEAVGQAGGGTGGLKPPAPGALEPTAAVAAELDCGMSQTDRERVSLLVTLVCLDAGAMTPGQLKRARQFAGLTLGRAAQAVGVSVSVLMSLEAGRETLAGRERSVLMERLGALYGVKGQDRPVLPWERTK